MADIADRANDLVEADLARRVAAARGDIKPGVQGDCDLCGEWSGRLIDGVCAPCRDKHGLP
jgi:hypothetical protein